MSAKGVFTPIAKTYEEKIADKVILCSIQDIQNEYRDAPDKISAHLFLGSDWFEDLSEMAGLNALAIKSKVYNDRLRTGRRVG